MTIEELKEVFVKDPRSGEVKDKLRPKGSKLHLKGLAGSSAAIHVAITIKSLRGIHLVILKDKEEAAYFMNDVQAVDDSLKTLFYPRSARVPYQTEQTENANVSMRAEVLSELAKGPETAIIVSFPEALAENVVTKKNLTKNTFDLKIGDEFDKDFIPSPIGSDNEDDVKDVEPIPDFKEPEVEVVPEVDEPESESEEEDQAD